jgi:hypothetical protein
VQRAAQQTHLVLTAAPLAAGVHLEDAQRGHAVRFGVLASTERSSARVKGLLR